MVFVGDRTDVCSSLMFISTQFAMAAVTTALAAALIVGEVIVWRVFRPHLPLRGAARPVARGCAG